MAQPARSPPAVHGRLAASVPAPVRLVSADEGPLGSCRSSEVLPVSLVQGSRVAEARSAPMADGRSRADPEDVLPLPAAPSAQAPALPASPTLGAGFQLPHLAALHDPAPVTEPSPLSQPAVHGRSAALVPAPVLLVSADEWLPVS